MKNILVVDKDRQFVKGLAYDLSQEGYKISALYDEGMALQEIDRGLYDLILLDIDTPDKNGLDICQEIREESSVPLIILSKRDNIMDQILALEYGADDYLVKPFYSQELKTRIKALFRRINLSDKNLQDENLEIGDFKINTIGRTIQIKGEEINLTGKEFDLFYILITNAGQIFTREELLELIWGDDYFGDGRTIDVHIRRIRKKLNKVVDEDIYILTKWGEGYYFEPNMKKE